jgi:hypothetical protein
VTAVEKGRQQGKDGPVSPLCSRNARSQKTLVGRAQWGTHPGHPMDNVHEQAWKDNLWSLAAALLGTRRVSARQGWEGKKSSLFEQPEGGNYSIDPRKDFRRPCFFLLSIRLFCEPFVGFVGFRFLRGIATL